MKLNIFNRKKTVLEKLTSTYEVKLDASASQLIMDVLAKLYDNPVEAAIREYVSNAYDANVEAGSTEPVHLHVPTEDEPYLEVSDTGNGLDYLGIVSVFANFGTSTKREEHTKQEYLDIANDSTLQPYEKIRKLSDMGISTYHLSYKTIHMAPEIPKELDEPAVKLSIVSDFMQKEYSISASTNKVRVDSNLDIFLIFDTELPKRPALKKFINWVIFETGDTYKPIKEMLQTNLSYNTVATTKRGYAKMVYTNNKSIANVQAAYDAFEKANVKTTDDLSDREFTYYDRWNNKYKTKMDAQWLSNNKCIIVHPNAKYRSTRTAIIELSKLRVPMPKVGYNDIEFITPKNKKEYDYLISLDPGTPTIDADDIANLNNYLNSWQICPNEINVLKTAQIFNMPVFATLRFARRSYIYEQQFIPQANI